MFLLLLSISHIDKIAAAFVVPDKLPFQTRRAMKVVLFSAISTSSPLADLTKSMERADDEDKSPKGEGAGNVSTGQFTEFYLPVG